MNLSSQAVEPLIPSERIWKPVFRSDLEKILTFNERIALDRYLSGQIEYQSYELESLRIKAFNLMAYAHAKMPAHLCLEKSAKSDIWVGNVIYWMYTKDN